jgi:P-type Ca2+ transporter type 2C
MMPRMDKDWHAKPIAEIVAELRTDPARGLSPEETTVRLQREGPNRIREAQRSSAFIVLLRQFRSLIIWILIAAAGISIVLGERLDSAVIIAIVILNALLGFAQEYRAERAAAALAKLTAPQARVIRGGQARLMPAAEIVRGDLLLLGEGDLVAADARLVEAAMMRLNEAPLTGESVPVEKQAGECSPDTALADRRNMLFLGTSVVGGNGRALVVATGMNTEVGHIARLLETASAGRTPLERQLDRVGWRLVWASLAIVAVVFLLGLMRGVGLFDLFLSAVSLAVAAIPEGLPAMVTVALALGVHRMVRRNALVRRLPAVETLGCVQVICTDKTGTLTVGEMTVRKLMASRTVFRVTGEGYSTEGAIVADGNEADAGSATILGELLLAAVACNDARLEQRDGRVSIIGDPTEGALLVAAAKKNVKFEEVDALMPRLGSVPFTSDRKRMTMIRRRDGHAWAFIKGAPEVIIERCSKIKGADGDQPLSADDRAGMLEASAAMAADALRVLAFAVRRLESYPAGDPDDGARIERDLTLLGVIGMQDPPRPEARDAIQKCKVAGIKTVMITGDHPDTARAIGRELGLVARDHEVLVGNQLESMSDDELAQMVTRVSAYARVTAEHKLRIVRAWKARGMVVAMTGDGVNDAPALKEASIGVAMGRTGTEVTKQSADIIITDDNFSSIVAAVEEGRGIYDNVVKTLGYLMGGNAGELTVMLTAAVVGLPMPLVPIQLLWINLVTDGLPALALATDSIEPGLLARPPRDPRSEIMDRGFFGNLALIGVLSAGVALVAFVWELHLHGNEAAARTATFSVLVIEELLRSFSARSAVRTVWEVGLLSNMRLIGVVAASFGLQLAICHIPIFQRPFEVESVTLGQWARWSALGLVPLGLLETRKLVRRTLRSVRLK